MKLKNDPFRTPTDYVRARAVARVAHGGWRSRTRTDVILVDAECGRTDSWVMAKSRLRSLKAFNCSFIEWLLNRSTENAFEGMRLKHDIVCALLKALTRVVRSLSHAITGECKISPQPGGGGLSQEQVQNLELYRSRGVVYVPTEQPHVALEGA